MASDHLWLRIIYGSAQHKVLMYSPSYVKGLKEELSLRHGVAVRDMEVFHEGVVQGDGERVVDGRVYVMRSLAPPPMGMSAAVEEGVFVGDGVTLTQDVVVHHSRGAQVLRDGKGQEENVYTVFGYRGIVHLVDMERRSVLSPALLCRLGRCVLYVDWGTLRMAGCGTVAGMTQTAWLMDRVGRDYGVEEGSVVEGIHRAGVDGIARYQNVVMAWLDAMGYSEGDGEGGEEEEEEEEEEEDEEEEEEERAWDDECDLEAMEAEEWWR
jgi:hypothetical protein